MQAYVVIYSILALGHIVFQLIFSYIDYRRNGRAPQKLDAYNPRISVVVPVFNEEPDILRACLESIHLQDYPDLEVLVVDDGSENVLEHEALYRELSGARLRVIELPQNVGKRHAQSAAFAVASGEVVVTVDSDTVFPDPYSMQRIVERFADPRIGAITGDVRVENAGTNLLTRLISLRYWMAFHQERAAQSLFRVVTCCSGPYSAYRKSILDKVVHAYTRQRFLGSLCTFGDDRHLTNLVLARGYDVVFEHRAQAYTHVPKSLGKFLKQQLRWSKSFYREILWTAKFAHRRSPYMGIDVALQAVLPFMLIVALAYLAFQAVTKTHGLTVVWHYLLVVLLIGCLRSLYGLLRTRNAWFALFPTYGFVHVLLLVPTRMVALFTMGNTGWGTRTLTAEEERTLIALPEEKTVLDLPGAEEISDRAREVRT